MAFIYRWVRERWRLGLPADPYMKIVPLAPGETPPPEGFVRIKLVNTSKGES